MISINQKYGTEEEQNMLEIEIIDDYIDTYDITVEENENFFGNNILVHNCTEIDLPTRPLRSMDDGATIKTVAYPLEKTTEYQDYKRKNKDLLFRDQEMDISTARSQNDGIYRIVDDLRELPGDNWVMDQVLVEDHEAANIALCILSAINWGNIRSPEDFEKPCRMAVRGLDALIDHQDYPVLAAKIATIGRRPLGIGIINFAYWLVKNNTSYQEPDLELIDQYMEAWSYYLIKASVEIAKEKGACPKNWDTKYSRGILPIDTYKKSVDELVPHTERMPWDELRSDLKKYGIRNSTLMAIMPAETSAQISNSTNGIEPPRGLVSVKQSKHGVMKQVVPGISRYKNKYDLLWDHKSPMGYLKIVSVMQKYIDQGISVNTSYNPQNYEDEKISMNDMILYLLTSYKYGAKQLYYFNTYDGQGEIDISKESSYSDPLPTSEIENDELCEACAI